MSPLLNKATNAGSYNASVTLTGAKSGNYNISSGATQAWSITKKSLSITASSTNASAPTNYTFDYDGNNHGVQLTVTGICLGDSPQFTFVV